MKLETVPQAESLQANRDEVFAYLDSFIQDLPVPGRYREMLNVQTDIGRSLAQRHPVFPPVQVPMLVSSAVGGGRATAVTVAAASTLVYLGADVLDNVMDDELPPQWRLRPASDPLLCGSSLLAAVMPLLLERTRMAHVLGPVFARHLLEMSVGQRDDLSPYDAPDPSWCREVAERKAGAEFALFAEAAAIAGGAPPRTCMIYSEMGKALGAATQIASDVGDLWRGEQLDLINGTKTLPVAHALKKLDAEGRTRFLELLEQCRIDTRMCEEITRTMRDVGSLRFSLVVVEVYRQRALRLLAAADPLPEAEEVLREYIESIRILETEEEDVNGGTR